MSNIERENTMVQKPALVMPQTKNFVHVLRVAMKVARAHGMDEIAMIKDVQSIPEIEDRKKRLEHYFEVV